ncbi:hypothetical protein RW1_035_00200 [Rhodococcus wratislaviensis NBRC 100605]|uniref:Uncharacterized protein n=1 Tax=Rhodococcus wratislaviensis NBRC 100605 TaxID=1219028 RepID=X0Q6A4_RHOWR|nr:hypothetical protein RW1_035_00200 [Rhodococcus wratislaviensis NBRC 100605]
MDTMDTPCSFQTHSSGSDFEKLQAHAVVPTMEATAYRELTCISGGCVTTNSSCISGGVRSMAGDQLVEAAWVFARGGQRSPVDVRVRHVDPASTRTGGCVHMALPGAAFVPASVRRSCRAATTAVETARLVVIPTTAGHKPAVPGPVVADSTTLRSRPGTY